MIKQDQLLSDEASVILIAKVIGISGLHTLQIDDVTSLVGAPDSLDLYTSCDFDLFFSISDLTNLRFEFLGNLFHQTMEFWLGVDRFHIIDTTILSQTRKL
jgi:hypothetical protein